MAEVLYQKQTSDTSPNITTAISTYDDSYAPWHAVDGIVNAYGWGSEYLVSVPAPWWWMIELVDPIAFVRVDLTNAIGYSADMPSDFTIEGSTDNSNWDILYTAAGEVWDIAETKSFTLSTTGIYKYYKIKMTAPQTDYKTIGEIDFYFEDGWTNLEIVSEDRDFEIIDFLIYSEDKVFGEVIAFDIISEDIIPTFISLDIISEDIIPTFISLDIISTDYQGEVINFDIISSNINDPSFIRFFIVSEDIPESYPSTIIKRINE